MRKLMSKKVLTIFALLSLCARCVYADLVEPIYPFDTPRYYQEERNSNIAIIIGAILVVVAISGILIITLNAYKRKMANTQTKVEEQTIETKEVAQEVEEKELDTTNEEE